MKFEWDYIEQIKWLSLANGIMYAISIGLIYVLITQQNDTFLSIMLGGFAITMLLLTSVTTKIIYLLKDKHYEKVEIKIK